LKETRPPPIFQFIIDVAKNKQEKRKKKKMGQFVFFSQHGKKWTLDISSNNRNLQNGHLKPS